MDGQPPCDGEEVGSTASLRKAHDAKGLSTVAPGPNQPQPGASVGFQNLPNPTASDHPDQIGPARSNTPNRPR